jgi:hypothetical protein
VSIHPALTLANKLREALDRWPDEFDTNDRIVVWTLIRKLNGIADRRVPGNRVRPW